MLSNNDLISVAFAFNNFYKDNITFSLIKESIESKKENDTFLPAQLEEIKQEYSKRKEELDKFKNALAPLESLLRPEIYNNLLSILGNEIASLDMMINDADNYLNTNDTKYIESVLYGFTLEKEQNQLLSTAAVSCQMDLGMSLLPKVLSGEIRTTYLEYLTNNLDSNSEIYKNISFVINAVNMQKKNEIEEKTQDNNQPVHENESEEPSLSENEQVQEQPQTEVPEPREPTLEEKIRGIEYKDRGNINREVQALTVEESLAIISAQIKELESKEKLNMRETIKLHNLRSQEIGFQSYMDKQKDKLSLSERIRENSLDKGINKIGDKEASLNKSKENHENYGSKTMRFFSARYQEGLMDNIASLQQKNGLLADKQKASSIARFNRESKKIAFKAKVAGLINGVKDITAQKIEELKQLKAEVIAEVSNIKHDIRRFTSKKEQLPQLQEATVVSPDNIISIEEVRRLYNEKRQIAA